MKLAWIELVARIKFYSPFYSPSLVPIGTNQCQEKGGVSGGVGAKNPATQALNLDMTGFQVFYDCSGTAQPKLNAKTVQGIELEVPSIEEQSKVGGLFEAVDNLIAANQRQLDLLKEQKKGFLQKMFV